MSSLALPRPNGTALYAIAGLVLLFELGVTWFALHPNVPADYRAYYIDQTTTCLNEPVSGDYAFGTRVSFRDDGAKLVKPLKVCGWEGPVGDGLHAVGESSRLRFALLGSAHATTLMLEMVAVDMSGAAGQEVDLLANGTRIGTVQVATGEPQSFSFAVPDSALATTHVLDVELAFPLAIRPNPTDSNTRKRSIKLTAAEVSGSLG